MGLIDIIYCSIVAVIEITAAYIILNGEKKKENNK